MIKKVSNDSDDNEYYDGIYEIIENGMMVANVKLKEGVVMATMTIVMFNNSF